MKKIISLIKACMTDNMSIFKIKNKKQRKKTNRLLPILLGALLVFYIWTYANVIMEQLVEFHAEFFLLTLFIIATSILTLMEGIYKSGNLLFNCKDDNLLMSLPIKKSTVLFVRVFKFYVFELVYNSLFLVPAFVVYVRYVSVNATFYLISLLSIFLLPIIPIVISCLIGAFTTSVASKFKKKNFIQIIISTVFLLGVLYISFNLEKILMNLAEKATTINDLITKLYYPAGAYLKLITEFKITDLIAFIGIHALLFIALIFIGGKFYFRINSEGMKNKAGSKKNNGNYRIKRRKPIFSLINKEYKKFISSPVFVTNAGFGLVLYVIGCIAICFKFDGIVNALAQSGMEISMEWIYSNLPIIVFGFILFTAFMTSITSSMISLEGKSFNILKSLPVSPVKIIFAKVLSAVIIMIPCIIIGDIILFTRFEFTTIEIFVLYLASIVLPFVSELMGILINLKYPKMDAESDTEVIKQSMSSMVSVFAGMALIGATIGGMAGLLKTMSVDICMLCVTGFYIAILGVLLIYLNKKGVKEFNNINV